MWVNANEPDVHDETLCVIGIITCQTQLYSKKLDCQQSESEAKSSISPPDGWQQYKS